MNYKTKLSNNDVNQIMTMLDSIEADLVDMKYSSNFNLDQITGIRHKIETASIEQNLQSKIHDYRDKNDLDICDTGENLAKALSVEAGELLELFLWNITPSDEPLKEEIADILIYAIAFADFQGWDYKDIVYDKIKLNNERGYHGNTKID